MDRAREEVEGSTGLGEEEDGEEEDTTITMATGVEEVIIESFAYLLCNSVFLKAQYCHAPMSSS